MTNAIKSAQHGARGMREGVPPRDGMDAPLLWSLQEVAQQLGNVSVRTVRRLIERGELPFVSIGRLLRVRVSDVHDWIALNSVIAHNQNCVEPEAWKGNIPCHTSAKIHRISGRALPMHAAKELGVLLALPTVKKRKR